MATSLQGEATAQRQTEHAVLELGKRLDAKFVNFFQPSTLENLDLPWGSKRYLIPTGSFAFGECQYGDDVHLVCLTDISEKLFWSFVSERLDLHQEVDAPQDAIMELSSDIYSRAGNGERGGLATFADLSRKKSAGCKFYLRYCTIPLGYDVSTMVESSIPAYGSRLVSPHVRANLEFLRHVQAQAFRVLLKPPSSIFARAYRLLRRWAHLHGLLGRRLGFLDAQDLAHILYDVYATGWRPEQTSQEAIVDHVLARAVEAMRAQWEATSRFEHWTYLSTEAVFALGAAALRTQTVRVLTDDPGLPLREFAEDHDYHLKVYFECWPKSELERTKLDDVVIPASLKSVTKFFKATDDEGVRTRLWPIPYSDADNECRATYIIGVQGLVRSVENTHKLMTMITLLPDELTAFDSSTGLVSIGIAMAADLQRFLALDYTNKIVPSPSHDASNMPAITAIPSKPACRFRDAHSAISRLRHDTMHSTKEYEVGYEDRFKTVLQWVPLSMWGGKATEEVDFIPEHRIRRLRRVRDGLVVWDRGARVDLTGVVT